MKSINVKIPMSLARKMDDEGTLNPSYLGAFIDEHVGKPILQTPSGELSLNYTFKIETDLHTKTKITAIQEGLAMNEYIGRLLRSYY